ncbi:ribonuclease domain-containing protein [Streptomyces parvus]|uniref:ribonuclease domain-containing protein n=1 Tax=Streptomyces parvus TaxID=66428 RepID=UPI00340EF379
MSRTIGSASQARANRAGVRQLKTWQKVVLGIASAGSAGVILAPVALALGPEIAALSLANPAGCATFAAEIGTGGAGTSGAASVAKGAALKQNLATAELANGVAGSLRATGKLPGNYVTKAEAAAQGWKPGKALGNKIPGAQLGGDVFQNSDGKLPPAPGRTWYEADIGIDSTMTRAKQPGTRLLYSNDGLAYVTPDHYDSFYKIPNWR